MTDNTDTPILIGPPTYNGSGINVWCPHCKRDHNHGRHDPDTGCRYDHWNQRGVCTCPPGTGDGHRTAHCHNPQSPYADTGYIVVEHPQPGATP